jgi:hypothetical protein
MAACIWCTLTMTTFIGSPRIVGTNSTNEKTQNGHYQICPPKTHGMIIVSWLIDDDAVPVVATSGRALMNHTAACGVHAG